MISSFQLRVHSSSAPCLLTLLCRCYGHCGYFVSTFQLTYLHSEATGVQLYSAANPLAIKTVKVTGFIRLFKVMFCLDLRTVQSDSPALPPEKFTITLHLFHVTKKYRLAVSTALSDPHERMCVRQRKKIQSSKESSKEVNV